jgi:hypothetical protein
MKKIVFTLVLCTLLFTGSPVLASEVFFEGFEGSTWGWSTDSTYATFNYGTITCQPTGDGSYHAVMTGGVGGDPDQGGTFGPWTYFDKKRYTWPGGFTASLDIYLDTSWLLGTGFGYVVAVNGRTPGLSPLAHYFFNVTMDSSSEELIVAANNWTDFNPREDLEGYNNAIIGDSGWYTFQHVFYDKDGYLAVDLRLLDADGTILLTQTFEDQYPIDTVGGNRYGMFPYITFGAEIAVDNSRLEVVTCPGDFNVDGDVDGSDLASLIVNPAPAYLEEFAQSFGRNTCP